MESSIRLAVGFIYFLAGLTWLGALVFIGYRVYQMRTLPVVEAEVLGSETESYRSTSYRRDATGWSVQTRSRMYVPTARVRYSHNGQVVTAEAKFDTGISWKWVQDRLTREWKPGSRIRISLDPAKPEEPLAGLGMNVHTFLPAAFVAFFGFFLVGCGWALSRLAALLPRLP